MSLDSCPPAPPPVAEVAAGSDGPLLPPGPAEVAFICRYLIPPDAVPPDFRLTAVAVVDADPQVVIDAADALPSESTGSPEDRICNAALWPAHRLVVRYPTGDVVVDIDLNCGTASRDGIFRLSGPDLLAAFGPPGWSPQC